MLLFLDALMKKAFSSATFNSDAFITNLLVHMGLLKVRKQEGVKSWSVLAVEGQTGRILGNYVAMEAAECLCMSDAQGQWRSLGTAETAHCKVALG